MELKNKKALVTGASGGIGSAIARKFNEKGVELFLQSKSKEIDLSQYHKDKAHSFKVDFKNSREIEKIFERMPALDILVNVVGIEYAEEDPFNVESWREIFEVNLFSAVKCTHEALKLMNHGGVVISISSIVGKEGVTYGSESIAYPASKAALNKLTEGIVALYSPEIRAVTVSPGYTKTPMWNEFDSANIALHEKEIPTKKFVQPDEVANAVVQIAENDSINGCNIIIDGGLGLRIIY